MKISKLLNKKNFFITLIFFFSLFLKGNSTEPIDIWNLENSKLKTKEKELEKNEDEISTKNSIYEMQSQKKKQFIIEQDETLLSKEIDIVGLYDPAENSLIMNMWLNSNGHEIVNIFNFLQV